ncbi:MAG: repressor LexA [Spirochaetes bacterium]|nr:MAG: repressor LexA [Spirochaetota bacterium]
MKPLTKRQEEVLAFIKSFINEHKYPPTIREIARHFKISIKGAYDHIKSLERKNYIHCDINRSRTIGINEPPREKAEEFISIPLLGNVAAGTPLFAEENMEGEIRLPSESLRRGKYFALHIKGDSMQDAGILDGDLAIFRHQATAENGDIIVAMVNDAFTLKRFYREKNRVKLKAENPVYPPIYTQNIQILGKLECIFRSYE